MRISDGDDRVGEISLKSKNKIIPMEREYIHTYYLI